MSNIRRVLPALLLSASLVAAAAPGQTAKGTRTFPVVSAPDGPLLLPAEPAPHPTSLLPGGNGSFPASVPGPLGAVMPEGFHEPVGDGHCAGGDGHGFSAQVSWDPPVQEKLLKEFTVTGPRYSPKDRRVSWALRTNKTYPGELGLAETKLQTALNDALGEKNLLCAYFYGPDGRKVGFTQVYLSPGERLPGGSFVVFADLSVANMEVLAARVVITVCERPDPLPDMPPPKDAEAAGIRRLLRFLGGLPDMPPGKDEVPPKKGMP